MKKSEFISWLENESGFSRQYDNQDIYWRELMNYAEYIWDILEVNEDSVIFNWEDWVYGGINYNKNTYTYEEFIERYKNYNLKG